MSLPQTNAMNSSPENPTPTREEEVNRLKETLEIFEKFFTKLFAVIDFMTTPKGEAFFKDHPNVMMVTVLMIVLYFFLWLMVSMLPQRNGIFLNIVLLRLLLVIGSICSVLIITIISSLIAWLTAMLWVTFFAVTAVYCCCQRLYELVVRAISDTMIRNWIDYYRTLSARFF